MFLVALNTLMIEILLIRVFDTILIANIGYTVITCAMFGLGLAGIFTVIHPPAPGEDVRREAVQPGAVHRFDAPDTQDWVVWVRTR